jgi:phospholipase/carboxylesterase
MEQFNIHSGDSKTFVVFHGTGGNEYSLLQFVGDLNPLANVRTYIGDVGEGVNRRYFAPLQNGQLDRLDFNTRVDAFLTQYEQEKPVGEVIFLGYSNGANFILGLLEKQPNIADTVILMHPSNLGYSFEKGSDAHIILTAGARDGISVAGESLKLSNQLQPLFANMTFKLLDHGHEINDEEIDYIQSKLV